MPDVRQQIADLVGRLALIVENASRLEEFRSVRLRPGRPASVDDILAYEEYLGRRLPESYRAFLELHNGYEGLLLTGDMLSIQDVVPSGRRYVVIQNWKRSSVRYGLGEVLDGIVIGSKGHANMWIFLDPNRPSAEKELTVVEWDPSTSLEFPTLMAFFERQITSHQNVIALVGRRR
jgi:hypothetical protein